MVIYPVYCLCWPPMAIYKLISLMQQCCAYQHTISAPNHVQIVALEMLASPSLPSHVIVWFLVPQDFAMACVVRLSPILCNGDDNVWSTSCLFHSEHCLIWGWRVCQRLLNNLGVLKHCGSPILTDILPTYQMPSLQKIESTCFLSLIWRSERKYQ